MNRFMLALLALTSTAAAAGEWTVLPERSRLAFRGVHQGEAFEGAFKRFTATIRFDPANVAATAIQADIDMASADTQNAERDETLVGDEFFATSRFPRATFRAHDCAAAGTGRYRCKAELTIRDRTQPLGFEFTWGGNAGEATLGAEAEVDRLAFDVGTGDWADPELIGRAVKVDVQLTLEPKT
jgi:polyisoprenoid-binding protein YceI